MAHRMRADGAALPAPQASAAARDGRPRPGIEDRAAADLCLTCDPVDPTEIEGDWRRLVAANPSIFSTYEWADSWWRTCHDGRERRVLAARAGDGSVEGIVPLYVERWGPVRVLRFIGDGASDELGPICRPEHRDAVAEALSRYLENRRGDWDLLIGRTMPGDAGWRRRLGAMLLNRESSPVLDVASQTWDDFLDTRSKHFRQRIRSADRKLRRSHDVEYRLVRDPEELPAAIDKLFALHRMLRAGRPSSFLRVERFHRDFLPRAHAAGWLRLWLLDVDGESAAATLEYTVDGVVHGYQMGIDPRWRKTLHVRVLVAMSLHAAFEDPDLHEFRIGRGGEEYKQRFAERDPGLDTVALGSGPMGRTLAHAMYRARAARPAARRVQLWARSLPPNRRTEGP